MTAQGLTMPIGEQCKRGLPAKRPIGGEWVSSRTVSAAPVGETSSGALVPEISSAWPQGCVTAMYALTPVSGAASIRSSREEVDS